MDKYAVVIDPKKVPKEKTAGEGDKDPHPDTNVPVDPERGTEPYEKEPNTDGKK